MYKILFFNSPYPHNTQADFFARPSYHYFLFFNQIMISRVYGKKRLIDVYPQLRYTNIQLLYIKIISCKVWTLLVCTYQSLFNKSTQSYLQNLDSKLNSYPLYLILKIRINI